MANQCSLTDPGGPVRTKRSTPIDGGLTTSALLLRSPLERGVDRHRVAVSQTEIPLQPGHNGAGFYTRLQQALFLGELLKLLRCLACLRFDVVYVRLE